MSALGWALVNGEWHAFRIAKKAGIASCSKVAADHRVGYLDLVPTMPMYSGAPLCSLCQDGTNA